MTELEQIKERLNDHRKLSDVIHKVFYSSSIDGAAINLAAAIERYALGLSLISVDEELRIFLSTLSTDERAVWWRKRNEEAKANGF